MRFCIQVLFTLSIALTAFVPDAIAQTISKLKVPGLLYAVEVLRDAWGVNHIYAANQHDLFFAQGYCAAKDRLFQFELWRRQANGTMAEIWGPRELQRDLGARLFSFRGNMDKELHHYHPQGKAIILAFTAGVNAYIDQANKHPEQLPAEFLLLHILPGRWTPAIVISRHQGILGNVTAELSIGRSVSAVGEKKVKELLWLHPGNPVLQMDSVVNGQLLSKDILALYNAWRKDPAFTQEDIDKAALAANAGDNTNHPNGCDQNNTAGAAEEGSNNWAVSGSRTASGHALLASDPHRKIALPSLRYIVHLSAPGWNVSGGGEPEIPGVAIGHNEDGAWGITVHQTDAEDLYVYDLNPVHLNQYWYRDNWVNMREIKETIVVKNTGIVSIILRYTQHGPVCFIDSANHKAYALRAAWLETGAAPYLASLRMDQAKDWASFREACSYAYLPALNMVWADKNDHIGWQVTGRIPVRKNFSGLVPVPGDGRYEWAGFLPIKERPHTSNPSKGFIATANEDLIPADFKYPEAMGFTWPDAYRANRLKEILQADNALSIEKMKVLQTDYFSLPARETIPLLQNIRVANPLAQQAKEILLKWNFVMDTASVGAAIYNKWEREMKLQGDSQFIPAAIKGLITLQTTRLNEWLMNPGALFGEDPVRSRNQFLQQTFEMAVYKLQIQLGNNAGLWQFGQDKYKHISFTHPLGDLVSDKWKQQLNTGSLPRGGYGHTVGATGNQDNQGNGASFRYITDTSNWDATVMTNTPGQSGNPESPWYKNLFASWAKDQYFPAYFSKEKINRVTAESVWLIP
ncbi:MAG: penicillin acylase family protein [Chitinophagaceae bacterium]